MHLKPAARSLRPVHRSRLPRHAADPSEDPFSSTTRGVNPRGMRDSTHGSASISSRTGRMTSGIPGPYTSTDATETSNRLRIAEAEIVAVLG